jgi:hypothetical protein
MTAMVCQVWRDSDVAAVTNVFMTELQLELFPLETDLFSMEYEMLPEAAPEGMPSPLFIQMASRALSKLQDVTGTVHRFQSLGSMGEEVLTKIFHTRVNEYIAASSGSTGLDDDGIGGGDNPQPGFFGLTEDNATPVPVDDSNNVAMLIIDGKVDMVTPMVTPLSYEGLTLDLSSISMRRSFILLKMTMITTKKTRVGAVAVARTHLKTTAL